MREVIIASRKKRIAWSECSTSLRAEFRVRSTLVIFDWPSDTRSMWVHTRAPALHRASRLHRRFARSVGTIWIGAGAEGVDATRSHHTRTFGDAGAGLRWHGNERRRSRLRWQR